MIASRPAILAGILRLLPVWLAGGLLPAQAVAVAHGQSATSPAWSEIAPLETAAPVQFDLFGESVAKLAVDDTANPPDVDAFDADLDLASLRLIAQDPGFAPLREAVGWDALADKVASAGPAEAAREIVTVPLRRAAPRVEFLHYRQRLAGHPVLGSIITIGWGREGRLRSARASVFPVAGAPAGVSVGAANGRSGGHPAGRSVPAYPGAPSIRWLTLEEARAAAAAGWTGDPARLAWDGAEQAWLPMAPGLRPVWSLTVRALDPVMACRVLVDGESGAILARTDLLCHADRAADPTQPALAVFNGRILGGVEPRTAGDPVVEVPFPYLGAELEGDGYSVSGLTDRDGRFRFDVPAVGEFLLRPALSGRYAKVINASRGYLVPSDSIAVTVPGGAEYNWTGRASAVERNAYVHVTRAWEFTRALDDGPALESIDRPIDVIVDIPTSPTEACNAWWNGQALGFYAETQYCRSFARIADMVYHEYAHAVTQAVTGGMFTIPSDINEAWSDYSAATLTGDPWIGLSFVGSGTFVRELETDRRWPEDANPIPHTQGLILAGALWDLRRELGPARTDSLFHFARYGVPQSFEQYLFDLLTVDDDDGVLENGTPHSATILQVFRAHGLGMDTIRLAAEPLPDQRETLEPVELTVDVITPLSSVRMEESGLFVRRGDAPAYTRLPLERVSGQRWRAFLSLPPAGEEVRYYWKGVNAAGSMAVLPDGAPGATWEFSVLVDVTPPEIVHEAPSVAVAGYGALPVRAELGDDSGRLGAAVVQWRIAGGGEEGESPLAWERDRTWTGVVPFDPQVEDGTIEYRLRARDRAPEPNETVAPAGGWYAVPVRAGRLLDFEQSDSGLVAQGDWEWGAPADPDLVYRGRKVFATTLDGVYRDNISSSLVWGPIDLAGWSRARLQFRHLYRTEPNYDGGSVHISINPSIAWRQIPPAGGYPDYARPFGPAYGGTSDGWEEAVFPLDYYVGRRIWIRFQFDADRAVRDLGWYLDDLTIVEAQALVPPERLTADHLEETGIWLRWEAPGDVDPRSLRFLGYRVDRAVGDEAYGADPWRVVDRAETAVVDPVISEGTRYRYRLRALYDEGASEAREIEITPAAGRLTIPDRAVTIAIRDYAARDTTVFLANAGTAALRYASFVSDAEEIPDDVRNAFDLAPAGDTGYLRLAEDPVDAVAPGLRVPDLAAIDVRQRTGTDGLWRVDIRLTGHEAWGDPRRDWGGWIFLDRDGDPTTCRCDLGPEWGQAKNIGHESVVVFGALTAAAGHPGEAAVLFGGEGSTFPVPLTEAALPAGGDTVRISIPLTALGYPDRLQLAVAVAHPGATAPLDQVPDLPTAMWLGRTPAGGEIAGGRTVELRLNLDAEGLSNGLYRASLLFESPGRRNAWQSLPVSLRVDRELPLELASLVTASSRRALQVRFRLRPEVVPDSVWAERAEGEAWVRVDGTLPGTLLQPDSAGEYSFVDSLAVAAEAQRYRIEVRQGSLNRTYGPFDATWTWQAPPLEEVELRSTAEGIEGAFRIPASLDPAAAIRLDRQVADLGWRGVPLTVSEADTTGLLRFVDRWQELRPGSIQPGELCRYRVTVDFAPQDSLVYHGLETVFQPPVPVRFEFHPPRPNPFRDRALLRLDLPTAGRVQLDLFDVQGRRCATLASGEYVAGIHHLTWDGRGRDGRPVPAGVYWARVRTPAGSSAWRVLRLR